MSQQRMLLPPSCVLMTSYLTASLFPVFCDLTEEGEYPGCQRLPVSVKSLQTAVFWDGPLQKLWGWGGGGRGIFEPQEFFFVIKFLV